MQVENVTQPQILVYHFQNYSITLNGTQSSLHINLTYEPSASYQQVSWRHNGYAIDSSRNPRIDIATDGGLTINEVEPPDAGNYDVIACNRRGCESARFSVYISCK